MISGLLPACSCNDREAQAVAAMVRTGVCQIEASRIVYGTGPVLGSSPEVVKAWAATVISGLTASLRKAVGLC